MTSRASEGTLFIGGSWRPSLSGQTFEVIDPSSRGRLADVSDGGGEDTAAAIEAAARAFPDWAARTAYERSGYLHEAHRLMLERSEELAKLMTSEQGKPIRAARTEVKYGADFLIWFAEEAKRIYGQLIPSARADQRFAVLRQPVGVVGAITPWNYPISMITRKLGPALAAGCTVVLKPAEHTPLCAGEMFLVFDDADPVHAARGAAMVKVLNTGQACISPNRILVQASIAEEFVAALADRLGRMRAGNGHEE